MTPYWTDVIERARKRGKFTQEEKKNSYHWVTCACGEQDALIPRNADGEPKDFVLSELGAHFYAVVSTDKVEAAATALAAIELRAAQVIQETLDTENRCTNSTFLE